MAERAQLEAWIAATRRRQRTLWLALLPAAVAAIAVMMLWSRPIGGLSLVSVAIVGLFGTWILSSHVSEWEAKLRPPPAPRTPNQHGKPRREPD